MGQQVFIPNGGGGGGGGSTGSVFLADLFQPASGSIDYSLATGGDVFLPIGNFSVLVAFRVVQDNPAETINIFRAFDSSNTQWTFKILPDNKLVATINNSGALEPESSDLPLGRVFIAVLVRSGGAADLYINGRLLGSAGASNFLRVAPFSVILGGNGAWARDYIEYIGFSIVAGGVALTGDQISDIYIASQDAGRVVFPSTIVPASYAIYNADTGLTDINLWTPEINTLGAPDLPAVPSTEGLEASLVTAPFHAAQSGWNSAP